MVHRGLSDRRACTAVFSLYPGFSVTTGEGEVAEAFVSREKSEDGCGILRCGMHGDLLATLASDTELEAGIREGGCNASCTSPAAALVDDAG